MSSNVLRVFAFVENMAEILIGCKWNGILPLCLAEAIYYSFFCLAAFLVAPFL
jgi:hypothetical protein